MLRGGRAGYSPLACCVAAGLRFHGTLQLACSWLRLHPDKPSCSCWRQACALESRGRGRIGRARREATTATAVPSYLRANRLCRGGRGTGGGEVRRRRILVNRGHMLSVGRGRP